MQSIRIALCALGAMVGAGIASGREIMQFFSRYGVLSWALLGWTGVLLTLLIDRVMKAGAVEALLPQGKGKALGEGLLALLLMGTGGGMTAAAGELTALTVPLPYARSGGMLLTLLLCALLARSSCSALAGLSLVLLPGMILACLLCLRLPGEEMRQAVGVKEGMLALLQTPCYAGMNVMMAAGALCPAGRESNRRENARGAVLAGLLITAALALCNAVLTRHGELMESALPMVVLLRAYGKGGYYLSAAVLYLAVTTTLLAAYQTLKTLLDRMLPRLGGAASSLAMLLVALLGFDRIVAVVYPALGGLCFLLLMLPKKKAGE